MPKTMLQFGRNNLHALGARLGDYVGTKTWAHTEGGTCPLLLRWNADDGQLAAVIEAFALGNLRTGGTTGSGHGLAGVRGRGVSWPWRAPASKLCRRRPRYWRCAISARCASTAPRPPAGKLAARIADEFGDRAVQARACASMAAACDGADVVTLATRAREPFLHGGMPRAGSHLNASRRHRAGPRGIPPGCVRPGRRWRWTTCPAPARYRANSAPATATTGAARRRCPSASCARIAGPWTPTQPCSRPWARAFPMSPWARKSCAAQRQHGVGRSMPAPVKSKPRFFAASPTPRAG